MACRGVKVEVIEPLEIADALERWWNESAFSIKSMKDDALEEVAEGEVMVLGKRFQHFEDAFFHSDAGLDSLDLQLRFGEEVACHGYPCTRVHRYLSTVGLSARITTTNSPLWLPESSDWACFSHNDN